MDDGGASPCLEVSFSETLRDENSQDPDRNSHRDGFASQHKCASASENVNTSHTEGTIGQDRIGDVPSDCMQRESLLERSAVGANLGEPLSVEMDDGDDDDDIVVTRRKAEPESDTMEEGLTTLVHPPQRRRILRKMVTESFSVERTVTSEGPGEGEDDFGTTKKGSFAVKDDVAADGNEYWDEEDELANYIASREKEGENLPDDGVEESDEACGDEKEDDQEDDDEMNENLIEEDLDDDDDCRPEARLADPGDKLGGDWTPEVRPMDELLKKMQERHQQTLKRAKQMLSEREEMKREQVRADFEKISKMLAQEDVNRNSEDEYDQVVIVPDEPEDNRVNHKRASEEIYLASDGSDSDFDLDDFDSDNSEEGEERNDASEADEHGDREERGEVSFGNGEAIQEAEACDSAEFKQGQGEKEPRTDANKRSASSSMLVDETPLENGSIVEVVQDETDLNDDPSIQEGKGHDLDDSRFESEGAQSEVEDGNSARVGSLNRTSQNSGDSDAGEPIFTADGGNSKRKHSEIKGRSAFVEYEAEMSDDEGHTDDEVEDGMDEELADFLRGEQDIVDDPRKQDAAHKKWEAQNDMKALRDVVRGIRGGWRRKRRKKSHHALEEDDDDGSIDGARRRRVATVSESESDQENEISRRNGNVDSSDDDGNDGGSQAGIGEDELDDDLLAGLDVFEPVAAMGPESNGGDKQNSKAVNELMESLVSSDMADMVDLTDMETQPQRPPEGQSLSSSLVSFGRKRTDNALTVNDFHGGQRGSVWDTDEGGGGGPVAPTRLQQQSKTCMPTGKGAQDSTEGSVLLSMLGRLQN